MNRFFFVLHLWIHLEKRLNSLENTLYSAKDKLVFQHRQRECFLSSGTVSQIAPSNMVTNSKLILDELWKPAEHSSPHRCHKCLQWNMELELGRGPRVLACSIPKEFCSAFLPLHWCLFPSCLAPVEEEVILPVSLQWHEMKLHAIGILGGQNMRFDSLTPADNFSTQDFRSH